jgi:hypothetical protein
VAELLPIAEARRYFEFDADLGIIRHASVS